MWISNQKAYYFNSINYLRQVQSFNSNMKLKIMNQNEQSQEKNNNNSIKCNNTYFSNFNNVKFTVKQICFKLL